MRRSHGYLLVGVAETVPPCDAFFVAPSGWFAYLRGATLWRAANRLECRDAE